MSDSMSERLARWTQFLEGRSINAVALKEMKESAKDVLKFDFLVIGGVITVLTFLKPSRFELLEYASEFQIVSIGFSIVLLIDFAVYSAIGEAINKALASKRQHAHVSGTVRVLLAVQGWPNAFCVFILLASVTQFPAGIMNVYKEGENRAAIQDEIDRFVREVGVSPNSLEEVRQKFPAFGATLRKSNDKIEYAKQGKTGYSLTFIDPERPDHPWVVNPTRKLREFFDERRRELEAAGGERGGVSKAHITSLNVGPGWYLLSPPLKNAGAPCIRQQTGDAHRCAEEMLDETAPYARWEHSHTFDSANECEKRKKEQSEYAQESLPNKIEGKSYRDQLPNYTTALSFAKARCVAANDPRLAATRR